MTDLIQQAKDTIDKHYDRGAHTVGSAIKTKAGDVYTSVSIKGQKSC